MENTTQTDKVKQKNSTLRYLIYGAIAILTILVIWAIISNNKKSNQPEKAAQAKAIVTITKDGFTPGTISVQANTTVEWQNTDSKPHQVGANPYPSHSDLPDLNSKTIMPGEKYSFTFVKAGEFKYYDGNELKSHGVVQVK